MCWHGGGTTCPAGSASAPPPEGSALRRSVPTSRSSALRAPRSYARWAAASRDDRSRARRCANSPRSSTPTSTPTSPPEATHLHQETSTNRSSSMPQSPARLADWFALGWRALDVVVDPDSGLDEVTVIQLWPEHFDAGTTVTIATGTKVNLGFSPGDSYEPEPYLYVGPWEAERRGDPSYWNAPFGAILRAGQRSFRHHNRSTRASSSCTTACATRQEGDRGAIAARIEPVLRGNPAGASTLSDHSNSGGSCRGSRRLASDPCSALRWSRTLRRRAEVAPDRRVGPAGGELLHRVPGYDAPSSDHDCGAAPPVNWTSSGCAATWSN